MNVKVRGALWLAATLAALTLSNSVVTGPDCSCTHQGLSVYCPAGLPSGSRSVQFVTGGTMWASPTGRVSCVPQTTFACTKLSSIPLVQQSKTTTALMPIAPHTDSGHGSKHHSHGLLDRLIAPQTRTDDGKTYDDILQRMGGEISEQPHSAQREPAEGGVTG